jgi:hypothetical protein
VTPRKTTRPNHMTPAERDECMRLYLAGTTLDCLAEIFDRERCTIGRLVARRGVKRGRQFVVPRIGFRHSEESKQKIREARVRQLGRLTNYDNVVR